jgi:hypothetical protein
MLSVYFILSKIILRKGYNSYKSLQNEVYIFPEIQGMKKRV